MSSVKRVRAEFNHIHVPMLEDEDRMLYSTVKVLALVTASKEVVIKDLYRTHGHRLSAHHSALRAAALETLRENRVEFGQLRIRDDMHIPSLPDITFLTSHIKTPEADAFRTEITRFALDNVRRSLITVGEYQDMVAKLQGQIDALMAAQPAVRASASAAGAGLAAHRGTKHLRLVNTGPNKE